VAVGRRFREIERLDDLPAPCRACVFWEVGGWQRGPSDDRESALAAKEAWWRASELEWGLPGRGAYVEDELVGYVTFGPPAHFARAKSMGRAVDEQALLLATLWVAPEHREGGIGKALVQTALREAAKRGLRAVEAFAVRDDQPGPWRCLVPESFLLAQGFTVRVPDPVYPLLRLDLRQTVRWQESVGHALESVVTALGRRERLPRPAPETGGLARSAPGVKPPPRLSR
jgi:GNAT superfamily N-acetyltransferase